MNHEPFALNCKAGRPLDGKRVGSVEDSKRLWFSFSAQAEGKIVLRIQQPGIACPGREQDQFAEGHDARVPGLCEFRDVANLAMNVGADETGSRAGAALLLARPMFPSQSPLGRPRPGLLSGRCRSLQ